MLYIYFAIQLTEIVPNNFLPMTGIEPQTCNYIMLKFLPTGFVLGSGTGTVGRAVASSTRDSLFDSRHRQFLSGALLTINCIEKMKIIKKKPWNSFLKSLYVLSRLFTTSVQSWKYYLCGHSSISILIAAHNSNQVKSLADIKKINWARARAREWWIT